MRDKEKKAEYDRKYRERLKAQTERVNRMEAEIRAGTYKPAGLKPGQSDRAGSTGSLYRKRQWGDKEYSALLGR